MRFKGWVRTSLIDFPERLAAVLFTGGCNFRCPMCHNAALVLQPQALPNIPATTLWDFLERRRGQLEGLVITGGEPTLDAALPAFLRQARALGYALKLDTNGSCPEVLAALLEAQLLDFIAMDVKAPPEKYPLLVGLPALELAPLHESMRLIRESGLPYEFRTTVVPGLLDAEDIAHLAAWIADARCYTLQQFRGSTTLDPALAGVAPYPAAELQRMAERARRYLPQVNLRGL